MRIYVILEDVTARNLIVSRNTVNAFKAVLIVQNSVNVIAARILKEKSVLLTKQHPSF